MKTGWPYDTGTSEIGDRPDEPLADRAAGREHPPFEAPAAAVNVPAPRAGTTARAKSLPGEQATTGQLRSVRVLGRTGQRQILLDVRHPLACRPDGGRRRQHLPRPALVLPGHMGMHRTLDLASGNTGRHRPGHGRNAGDTRRAGNGHRSRPPSAGIRLAFDQASPGHTGITNRLRSGLQVCRSPPVNPPGHRHLRW